MLPTKIFQNWPFFNLIQKAVHSYIVIFIWYDDVSVLIIINLLNKNSIIRKWVNGNIDNIIVNLWFYKTKYYVVKLLYWFGNKKTPEYVE